MTPIAELRAKLLTIVNKTRERDSIESDLVEKAERGEISYPQMDSLRFDIWEQKAETLDEVLDLVSPFVENLAQLVPQHPADRAWIRSQLHRIQIGMGERREPTAPGGRVIAAEQLARWGQLERLKDLYRDGSELDKAAAETGE